MSIQQASRKLFPHGLKLTTTGNWLFDVVDRKTNAVVKERLTPEEVRKFTLDVRLKANMMRMVQALNPVLAPLPVRSNRKVWRVRA